MANLIKLGQGTYSNYSSLSSKDQYTVYFCTDTHQIFVGAEEYTKSTKVLGAEPTSATAGDTGRLYAYNGSLWLCTGGSAGTYTWIKVANVSTTSGTVTSVAASDGLTTDQTSGGAITSSGTIKHAVPSGASTHTDSITDQTPAFGSTFNQIGVATDKFGHVTALNTHKVTLPSQTPVTVANQTGSSVTLSPGDSFTVVTGVGMSTAVGHTDHDLSRTVQTFTLPSDQNVTYTVTSTTEGVVTLTGSDASSSTALINGWNDLAKKSDISSVFKYKGTKASVGQLPTIADVGDVWQVGTDEYVCVVASSTGSPAAQYEKLGPVVDLSAYATTAYVDDKLSWQTF